MCFYFWKGRSGMGYSIWIATFVEIYNCYLNETMTGAAELHSSPYYNFYDTWRTCLHAFYLKCFHGNNHSDKTDKHYTHLNHATFWFYTYGVQKSLNEAIKHYQWRKGLTYITDASTVSTILNEKLHMNSKHKNTCRTGRQWELGEISEAMCHKVRELEYRELTLRQKQG